MPLTPKPVPGDHLPPFTLPRVGGGEIPVGSGAGWRMLVVYRGRHCPLCRVHLKQLNDMADRFRDAGVEVAAVSADSRERAEGEAAEEGWTFPVGYDLSEAHMRALGVYMSAPASGEDAERTFAEPGLFVAGPDGRLQIVSVSNAPAARPDLPLVLRGVQFLQKKDPAPSPRGLAS